MVMSIKEEITALEEQLENTKGPGSKAKKVDIQAKIDALEEQDKPTEDESKDGETPEEKETREKAEEEARNKEEEEKPKKDESKPSVSRPGPIEEAKLEKFPGRLLPQGKEWIKVKIEQVLAAEREGTLQGFDPDKMIALIRGK